MEFTFRQQSKIVTQGEQLMINISKKFHEDLKKRKLLKKDLKITISLSDNIEVS